MNADSNRERFICGLLFGLWMGHIVAEGVILMLEAEGHRLRTAWRDGRQTGREIMEAHRS